MFAATLAPALERRGVHYGLVMAGLTFVTMIATAASMGMPGVLMVPLETEFHWDAASISGALAVRLMLFGALAPFAAALLQRYGYRKIVCGALACIVAGLAAAAFMTQLWQLWICWGLMVGIGTGLTAMVLAASVANAWFATRRGLVLGILTASNATGQLLFLPVAAWLAEVAGWRLAVLPPILGCALAFVLVLLLGANHPSEVNLPAYGERKIAPPPTPMGNAVAASLGMLREASGRPVFWILFGTFFICGLSTNGLIQTHFIPLCHDFGMTEVAAASVLATMGAFDVLGTIGSGWLSDRYDVRYLLGWYYGLRGLSLLALPYSTFSLYGLSVFAVFYGLDWVATVPPTVRLAGREFGRERAAMAFGWIFMGHQLGAASAALGGGLTRTYLDTYLPAFYVAGALCLVAAVAACFARPRPDQKLAVAVAAE
jgi:MFS family permease